MFKGFGFRVLGFNVEGSGLGVEAQGGGGGGGA